MTTNGRSLQEVSSSRGTSRSLLARVRDNDAVAWDNFVNLYSPLIYYWCSRNRVPAQEMPDVFQEVFQAVAKHIHSFRHRRPGDTFRGWLRTVTRSKVADYFRRTGKQPPGLGGTEWNLRLGAVADVDDEPIADEGELRAERELFSRAIEMIRHDFQEQTWEAFWRTVVDGKDANQVGQELGMRPGTVRVAKSRVLKRLREQLGDLL